jgi:hypothetical protein
MYSTYVLTCHHVAFRATATLVSFAYPKETRERKRHHTARPSASLRYSANKASAELALTDHTPRWPVGVLEQALDETSLFTSIVRRAVNGIEYHLKLHHCTIALRKPHYQLSRVGRFWPRVYLTFKRPCLQLNELKAAKYGEFNVDCHFDFDDIFVAIDRKNRLLYFIDILSLTGKMF